MIIDLIMFSITRIIALILTVKIYLSSTKYEIVNY